MSHYAEKFEEREAKVVPNDLWGSEPWFACYLRHLPHDAHVTNEGNTHCPGKAGIIPADPVGARERLETVTVHYEAAQDRMIEAQRTIARYGEELIALRAFLGDEP